MGFAHRVAGLPRLLFSAALIGALTAGCARPAPQTPPPAPSAPVVEERSVDWWLNHLTLEEKVGQLFWFGLKDAVLEYETEQLIKEGKAGGFIFFARQGSQPATLKALTDNMQALGQARERATPGLVISIDHEGGIVQRWEAPFTSWPGAMAIGATGSEEYARKVGEALAQETRTVGLNMNLSPVADVNNNPANPVIGVRSFGEDPAQVGRLVTAFIQGAQGQNVSAVAKHFPGHGDTNTDSHKALPIVNHSLERLEQVELVPFKAAMAADVDAIMSAHILFPAVAKDGLPGTLSPDVLTGLLKGKLGFKGVVVTDAIDSMKAITDQFGMEKALVMAVQAGADALLVTDSFGLQAAYHGIVLQAVKDGKITEARLNDAARRNLELKAKRGLLPKAGAKYTPPPAAPGDIGSEAHKQLANQLGADALTLVRNKNLPLNLAPNQLVLAIGPSYSASVPVTPEVSTALGAGIKAMHPAVNEITLGRRPDAGSVAVVKAAAEKAAAIVYAVTNSHNYPEHQQLLKDLIATGKPVIVVGMGEPYDLTALPEIQDYVAAYSYQAPSLQGVGALLFGKATPKGKLPVTIPGLYPAGHGLSY
jgi:beta-N-acetylhexosaminidase